MQKRLFRNALVTLSVLSFFNQEILSQTYSNKESSVLSFTVGMTSSNLINAPVKYRSGILYNGGLAYSLTLNEKLNAGIELLYTGKAFKNDSPIIKYRMFYVDIPLYLQIKLGAGVRINAGGQYSIAANGQRITLDPGNANGVHSDKISPIKSNDYGFLAGVEVDLSKQLSLGARYTISGSTFFEKDGINFAVFQLSLKYSPIRTYKVFFGKKEKQE
jgi:opacity protein-like surface antigen